MSCSTTSLTKSRPQSPNRSGSNPPVAQSRDHTTCGPDVCRGSGVTTLAIPRTSGASRSLGATCPWERFGDPSQFPEPAGELPNRRPSQSVRQLDLHGTGSWGLSRRLSTTRKPTPQGRAGVAGELLRLKCRRSPRPEAPGEGGKPPGPSHVEGDRPGKWGIRRSGELGKFESLAVFASHQGLGGRVVQN